MTCAIDGCGRLADSRGWCSMHYKRWRRWGDPLVVKKVAQRRNPVCEVDGCDRKHHANGLCGLHDGRMRYHGHPLAGGPQRVIGGTVAERFDSHVDRRGPDECWHWLGSTTPVGYGQFHNGRLVAAHRMAVELATGTPVPPDLDVDHLCHNADLSCAGGYGCLHRRCVNPAHLEAVTHAENVRRGRRFARTGVA